MKRSNALFVILFLISSVAFSQNKKGSIDSGKVIFDITFPDSQLDDNMKAMMPTESIMYFKGDLARVEVSMGMGQTVVISDNKSGDGTMLMDMMGNKWAIKISKEEMQKDKDTYGKPKVELTKETKTIAGYTAKKAIVTIKTDAGDKSLDAWFTNELKTKNSFSSQIEGIDGFLLEFYTSQNGMNMKMTAKSIEAMNVDDSKFKIPEGYEIKTLDELKGMGGKK